MITYSSKVHNLLFSGEMGCTVQCTSVLLVQTISTVAFTKLLDVPELGRYDAMHYFVSFVKISTTLFILCDQGQCETFVDNL